jgi:signal peptidase II
MASELASNSSEPETGRPPKRRSFASLLPIMLPVAAVVVALDRWSKGLAESELSKAPGQSVDVVDSVLRFSLIHNTGAAFNVLRDSSVLYVVIAAVVVIVSVGYYRYLPRDNYLLTVCLGMQLGGAIGNLIDRFQHVYVVDFIDVGFGDVRWPSFNVADSSIVVGIIVLAGYLMLHPDAERKG